MNILDIAIIAFIVTECMNVLVLYFKPELKYGNGIGVFAAYFRARDDKELALFTRYLINWVANAKFIFVSLLSTILAYGSYNVKFFAVISLILTILMYYISLAPIIHKINKEGGLTTKNYNRILNIMITCILIILIAAAVYYKVALEPEIAQNHICGICK